MRERVKVREIPFKIYSILFPDSTLPLPSYSPSLDILSLISLSLSSSLSDVLPLLSPSLPFPTIQVGDDVIGIVSSIEYESQKVRLLFDWSQYIHFVENENVERSDVIHIDEDADEELDTDMESRDLLTSKKRRKSELRNRQSVVRLLSLPIGPPSSSGHPSWMERKRN